MKHITREDVHRLIQADMPFYLVEALSPQAYEELHLPGAVNIPKDRVDELAADLLGDTSRRVVVYCANHQCQASATVGRRLESLGYEDVADYDAGKADWVEAGLPVESREPVSSPV